MSPELRRQEIACFLNRPQAAAFRALVPGKTVALPWGRGAGKSWFIRRLIGLLVAQYYGRVRQGALGTLRGVRIIGLMPTLKQFRDVHWAQLEDELSENWQVLRPKLNRSTMKVVFGDGSWFQPFPADLHRSRKARGLRADVVLLDECDDIPRSVHDSVVRPWFSEPWSLKMQAAAGTPLLGRHGLLYHLHKLGLGEQERYRSIFATWRDVPETVDRAEVLDAYRNSPPAVFKREWECDFDAAEGIVYGDVFDERFHVRNPPSGIVWNEILIGIDHGYEAAGVFLLIGVRGSGPDAEAWVLDEIYESHRTEDWWVAKLKVWLGWYPRAKVYGDPSMPARLMAYQKVGARLQPVDNSIEDGVQVVAERFHIRSDRKGESYAKLFITPKCVNTIRELSVYRRKADPREPDRFLDVIVDADNDAMDALRYPIFNRFRGPSQGRNKAGYDARAA